MKYLKLHLFATLAMATVMANAQVSSELNAEVDAEIDKMYVPSQPTIQPVQTVQVQTVARPAVQKQPVTVIEASPLAASGAENIRKSRQEEEMRTESRIVEKLEQSRMDDEKRRADVLFGDKFNALNNKEQAQPAQPVAQPEPIIAPSSNVQAQPIVIQQAGLTKEDVGAEVRAALDDKAASEEHTSLFETKYFSAVAGMPQYADVSAIRGNYSLGLAIGTSNDYFQVEGGFVYSNYNINNAQYTTQSSNMMYQYSTPVYTANFLMHQYQTYVSTKYQLLAGSVRPSIGGLAAYSYRKYVSDSWTVYGAPGTDFGNSSAIDLGIAAGLDLVLSPRFALGADLKYMFNMSANINGSTAPGAKSPEKLNYYLMGVSAKMMF